MSEVWEFIYRRKEFERVKDHDITTYKSDANEISIL